MDIIEIFVCLFEISAFHRNYINASDHTYSINCSRQKMPGCSWGRLSEARGVWGAVNLEGGGLGRGWVKWGQFTSNLGARRTDPVTARRVPSKWKKVEKGSKRGTEGVSQKEAARGNMKQGECAMYIATYVRVYKRMPETFEWYLSCMYIIITIGMNVDDNLNSV